MSESKTADFIGESWWPQQLRKWGTQLQQLVLPGECRGCGAWDQVVCDDCLAQMLSPGQLVAAQWQLQDLPGDTVPVFAVGEYDGSLRHLILCQKHDDAENLQAYFVASGQNLVESVIAQGLWNPQFQTEEVYVVPAPSTHQKLSPVVAAFASGICRGLLSTAVAQRSGVLQILCLPRKGKTQAGLGWNERVKNRHGKMRLIGPDSAEALRGKELVLVDDVCATGATLQEMWRKGARHAADTRLVNVHVQRLRAKVENDPDNPQVVLTVRGVGYRIGNGNS